jgi:hypothetical protein
MNKQRLVKSFQEDRESYKHMTQEMNDNIGVSPSPLISFYKKNKSQSDLVIIFPNDMDKDKKESLYASGAMANIIFEFDYLSIFSDAFVRKFDKDEDVQNLTESLSEDINSEELVMGMLLDKDGIVYSSFDKYGRDDNGKLLYTESKLEKDNKNQGGVMSEILLHSFNRGREIMDEMRKEDDFDSKMLVQQTFDALTELGFKIGMSPDFSKNLFEQGMIDEEGECNCSSGDCNE